MCAAIIVAAVVYGCMCVFDGGMNAGNRLTERSKNWLSRMQRYKLKCVGNDSTLWPYVAAWMLAEGLCRLLAIIIISLRLEEIEKKTHIFMNSFWILFCCRLSMPTHTETPFSGIETKLQTANGTIAAFNWFLLGDFVIIFRFYEACARAIRFTSEE